MFTRFRLLYLRITEIYFTLIELKSNIIKIEELLTEQLSTSTEKLIQKGSNNMEFSNFYLDFKTGPYEVACEGDAPHKSYYIRNSQCTTVDKAQELAENLAKKNPGKKFFVTGPIRVIETDIPVKSGDFSVNEV